MLSPVVRVLCLTAFLAAAASTARSEASPASTCAARDGRHDFDLRAGDWRVQHRRLKDWLAGSHEWIDFDGTLSVRLLMNGLANVSENVFNLPGGAYRGVSLRSYDPKTGLWATWWVDGRDPHGELDPPMKGCFENGNATFYGDQSFQGKPVRVRASWSQVSANAAHWEQAFSSDGGKTWEVNWISDFKRAPGTPAAAH